MTFRTPFKTFFASKEIRIYRRNRADTHLSKGKKKTKSEN